MKDFKELKEIANFLWLGMFELAACLWLMFTDFVRAVINYDWKKELAEWKAVVLSPQNRQEWENYKFLFIAAYHGLYYLVVLPFVMVYVAVENGVRWTGGKKAPEPVSQ